MAKAKTGRNPTIKGANAADKQNIALAKAANKADAKTQQTARGDQTPEAKGTKAEKSAAAKKLFDNADQAAAAGLPPDMTHEQHQNHVRRAALGY